MFVSDPKNLLDFYDSGITVSAVAVAAGIFGEYGAHFYFERPSGSDWHKTLITLFFGALVLGGVVGECIFGLKVSRLSKQIQQASDQKIAALRLQLGSVNLQIANSNAQAAAASRDAEVARKQSSETNERAGKLENDAAVQRKRASSLEREAEQLRQGNLATETRLNKANQDLENEKSQRLVMEESLAPRELPIVCCGPASNFLPLVPFKGMSVIIEYVPDAEAQRAAGEIETFLETARWHIISISPNTGLNEGLYDGIFIQYYSGRYYTDKQVKYHDLNNSMLCRSAADALSNILHQYDWEARVDIGGDDYDLQPNTLKIKVGMKPNRFPSRAFRDWQSQRDELLKKHGQPSSPRSQQ